MADITWMDYSGAPPILIPKCCLPNWHGFFLPAETDPEEEDEEEIADLELPDGRRFDVWDEFDFDHPRTDYDRVCAESIQQGRHFLYPVPPAEMLVISDYSDGTVGWWESEQMLLTVSRHLPDLSRIPESGWKNAITWRLPDTELLLMNACEFGTHPSADQCVEVKLDPGEYRIESYNYAIDFCVMVYRFRQTG